MARSALLNKTVLLLLLGDAFRSGNNDAGTPCNHSSLPGQREASMSFVRNVIAPFEAHGARVRVLLVQNECRGVVGDTAWVSVLLVNRLD